MFFPTQASLFRILGFSAWMEKGQPSIASKRRYSANGMPAQGHIKGAFAPAQLSDALHKSPGLFSASPTICYQHFPMKTPSYYTATAALPRGRCRVLTEHKPSSTVAFLTSLQPKQPQWKEEKHPNACSREPCTQILLPPLQLGGVRSPGLGQA